jgi:hypothetical protein
MQCKYCGTPLKEDALTCPECGKSTVGAVVSAPMRIAAPISPEPGRPAAGAADSDGARHAPKKKSAWMRWRKTLVITVASVVAAALVGTGLYLIWQKGTNSGGPDAAVLRVMDAFASYDAQAILDNVTHSSLTSTDEVAYAQQAVDDQKASGGQPAVRNVQILHVTQASPDATSAVVQLQAEWLSNGSYVARTESLTVVKQDGRWLVYLFP